MLDNCEAMRVNCVSSSFRIAPNMRGHGISCGGFPATEVKHQHFTHNDNQLQSHTFLARQESDAIENGTSKVAVRNSVQSTQQRVAYLSLTKWQSRGLLS